MGVEAPPCKARGMRIASYLIDQQRRRAGCIGVQKCEVISTRGLRTETTINNTRGFGIGRPLKNLPALREIGFQANRRLRLHGIIARESGTHRHRVIREGIRICLFMTKVHHRVIRPGYSQLMKAAKRP